MTSQDLVLVLGAYTALVLGAFTLLTKFVLDTRKQATETNVAVNNRPKADPTLRDLVENIDNDLRELRHESNVRHKSNIWRIERVTNSVDINTRKIDLLGDAVAGANDRLDILEQHTQGDGK